MNPVPKELENEKGEISVVLRKDILFIVRTCRGHDCVFKRERTS